MSLDITFTIQCNEYCPHCGEILDTQGQEVFETNITSNLMSMANEASVIDITWGACENVKTAQDMINPLSKGISIMEQDPDRFKAFDSSNGWGTYNDFLPWLKELLNAAIEYPTATVYTGY